MAFSGQHSLGNFLEPIELPCQSLIRQWPGYLFAQSLDLWWFSCTSRLPLGFARLLTTPRCYPLTAQWPCKDLRGLVFGELKFVIYFFYLSWPFLSYIVHFLVWETPLLYPREFVWFVLLTYFLFFGNWKPFYQLWWLSQLSLNSIIRTRYLYHPPDW